jgi:hypothetical protein
MPARGSSRCRHLVALGIDNPALARHRHHWASLLTGPILLQTKRFYTPANERVAKYEGTKDSKVRGYLVNWLLLVMPSGRHCWSED